MHGQGPCDKRRLLSCPIPYQLLGHPIYNTLLCGYGIGLGSLYRDTYVSDGAQRFYTTHIQYINREYVLHTKLETVWIGSDQTRCSTFNIFLQPNKLRACVHFVTDSTCLSYILLFIIHNQHINNNFTKMVTNGHPMLLPNLEN